MEKKKYSYNGYILFLLPVIFKCLSLNAKEAYDEYKPIKVSKYISYIKKIIKIILQIIL